MLGGNYNISFTLRSIHSRMTGEMASMSSNIQRARNANLVTAKQALSLERNARRSMALTRAEMVQNTMTAAMLTTAWVGAYKALDYFSKSANEFQYEAKAVGVLMGKNAEAGIAMYDSFKRLNPQIREFTGAQVLGTMRRLIQAGYSGAEAAKNTTAILNAVTGSFGELTQNTAEELGINLDKAFGTAGKGMEDLLDVAQQASNMFSLSTAQVASAMSYATEASVQNNQSLNDTLIAIGLLMPVVKQAGKAGTSFRAALANLSSPQTVKWLEKHNIALKDQEGTLRSSLDIYSDIAKKLKEIDKNDKSKLGIKSKEDARLIAGVRGGAFFTAMEKSVANTEMAGPFAGQKLADADAAVEYLRMGVGDSFGALSHAANSMRNTAMLIDKRLENAVGGLATEIGMAFMPVANQFKDSLSRLIEGMADTMKRLPAIVTAMEVVGTALGGVLQVAAPLIGLAMLRKGAGVGLNLYQGIASKNRMTSFASETNTQNITSMMAARVPALQGTGANAAKYNQARLEALEALGIKADATGAIDPSQKLTSRHAEALAREMAGRGYGGFEKKLPQWIEAEESRATNMRNRLALRFGPGPDNADDKPLSQDKVKELLAVARTQHSELYENLIDDMKGKHRIRGKTDDETFENLTKRLTEKGSEVRVSEEGAIVTNMKQTLGESLGRVDASAGKFKISAEQIMGAAGLITEGYAVFQNAVSTFNAAVDKEYDVVTRNEHMNKASSEFTKRAGTGLEMALKAISGTGLTQKDVDQIAYTRSGAAFGRFSAAIKAGQNPLEALAEEEKIGADLINARVDVSDESRAQALEQHTNAFASLREQVAKEMMPAWKEVVLAQAKMQGPEIFKQTADSLRVYALAQLANPSDTTEFEGLRGDSVVNTAVKDLIYLKRKQKTGKGIFSSRDAVELLAEISAVETELAAFKIRNPEAGRKIDALVERESNRTGEGYKATGLAAPIMDRIMGSSKQYADIAAQYGPEEAARQHQHNVETGIRLLTSIATNTGRTAQEEAAARGAAAGMVAELTDPWLGLFSGGGK